MKTQSPSRSLTAPIAAFTKAAQGTTLIPKARQFSLCQKIFSVLTHTLTPITKNKPLITPAQVMAPLLQVRLIVANAGIRYVQVFQSSAQTGAGNLQFKAAVTQVRQGLFQVLTAPVRSIFDLASSYARNVKANLFRLSAFRFPLVLLPRFSVLAGVCLLAAIPHLTHAATVVWTTSSGKFTLSGDSPIANWPNKIFASGSAFNVLTLTAALTLVKGQPVKARAIGGNTTSTITTLSGKGLTFS